MRSGGCWIFIELSLLLTGGFLEFDTSRCSHSLEEGMHSLIVDSGHLLRSGVLGCFTR